MKTSFISQQMVKSPYVITADQVVSEAWNYMRECDIRHLPVYKKEKIVGIVSDRDLRAALATTGKYQLLVEDIMKTDVYLVPRMTPVRKVVQYMADNKLGSALIVDANENLIGIFTTTDALYMLADMLEEAEQSDLILDDSDYWPRGLSH